MTKIRTAQIESTADGCRRQGAHVVIDAATGWGKRGSYSGWEQSRNLRKTFEIFFVGEGRVGVMIGTEYANVCEEHLDDVFCSQTRKCR